MNRKQKPSNRMKVTEDLKASSGGIPSSKRTEDAVDRINGSKVRRFR